MPPISYPLYPPESSELRDKCKLVKDIFEASSSKDKKQDARRLSDLCMDLATLVELDGDQEVVKTTEEIRQANSLSGAMLRMNIKGKYVRKKRTPVPAAPLFAFLKNVVHKNVKVIVLDAYENRKSAKKNGFDLSTIP